MEAKVYIDIFVAGVGKWYEFKCEEGEKVKNIIRQIYTVVTDIEGLRNIEQKQNQNEQQNLIEKADLRLACLESKKILDENIRLEECSVENGNKLILF